MRGAFRVGIAALGAAASLAATAPAAHAWVKAAKAAGDPRTTWIVTRTTITIRSSDPVLLRFVRGSTVLLGCASAKPVEPLEPRLPPPVVRWGRTASSVTARVRTPIGRNLTVCDAVGAGGDPGFPLPTRFSRAPFDARWRRKLASTRQPGPLLAHAQLSGYWTVVGEVAGPRYENRYGILVRLPPPRVLVHKLNRPISGAKKARSRVRYARTLRGVALPHVVYVIGSGSSRKKLQMAVIGFDGRLYVMRARPDRRPRFGRA
ncbi:MAG TPA: hypothetical protein VE127_16740 [Solirubrobacteraceae bacterium]|nr:hypothetical protein [Solirubrobacteraceae bacterium]